MTNSETNKKKMNIRGYVKKGIIFCAIGVMAIGMVACSGPKKSAASGTKAKSQTESVQTKDDKSSSSSSKKSSGTTSNKKKSSSSSSSKKSSGTQKSSKTQGKQSQKSKSAK